MERSHPKFRDNYEIVAGGPGTACSPSVLAAPIPPWGTPAAAGVAGSTPCHPNANHRLSRNLGCFLMEKRYLGGHRSQAI
jgi:hypothetical protein